MLTTGQWHFGGKGHGGPTRTFNADGTYSSNNSTAGTWKVTANDLEISWVNHGFLRYSLPIDPNGTRGVDEKGRPVANLVRDSKESKSTPSDNTAETDESTPAPTPPIPARVQRSASDIIKAHHDSLVFVTGTQGAGSGFIAAIGTSDFLITNVHVTAGLHDAAFKTLDGIPIQGGAPSLAVGEDIFCMARPPGGAPFEIMQNVDSNATIGDWVVVLGNAEGAGVVNTIIGRIVGIGPNLVEVDAPFVPGNSGSPIIHLNTGKVIGVATYALIDQYDLATDQKLKRPRIRRFGYRLDTVKGWQPVNWQAFNAQADRMDNIKTLTDDFYNFFFDLMFNKANLTPDWHGKSLIKSRVEDWSAVKSGHPSPEDAAEADANFISFLKTACQSDIAAAQGQITYDYFQRNLADQRLVRDQMAQAFERIIGGRGR